MGAPLPCMERDSAGCPAAFRRLRLSHAGPGRVSEGPPFTGNQQPAGPCLASLAHCRFARELVDGDVVVAPDAIQATIDADVSHHRSHEELSWSFEPG
jgi:hypothetical protein